MVQNANATIGRLRFLSCSAFVPLGAESGQLPTERSDTHCPGQNGSGLRVAHLRARGSTLLGVHSLSLERETSTGVVANSRRELAKLKRKFAEFKRKLARYTRL